jgi:hypothetical protein
MARSNFEIRDRLDPKARGMGHPTLKRASKEQSLSVPPSRWFIFSKETQGEVEPIDWRKA